MEDNFLGMSDDEFLKMNSPGVVEDDPGTEEESTETDEESKQEESVEEQETPDADEEESVLEDNKDPEPEEEEKEKDLNPLKGESVPEPKEKESPSSEKEEPKEEDYKALYEQAIAPIKANGKTLDLRDVNELRQLAQMGANYTRKMQDIAPYRKVLTMLQNNDLLDVDRLSFLIDVNKKNPEAIKKFMKESGIDPMDIDTTTEPNYVAGSNIVSDNEVRFRMELTNLQSTDTGKELLRHINDTWDDDSKQKIWAEPETLAVLRQQQENGVYAIITNEIDRQKALGNIPPETSFLQAYVQVGNHLASVNGNAPTQATPQAVQGQRETEAIATRAAAPKPKVSNSAQAIAAAPSRSAPQQAKQLVNPLAMSDDEFMKLMQSRV